MEQADHGPQLDQTGQNCENKTIFIIAKNDTIRHLLMLHLHENYKFCSFSLEELLDTSISYEPAKIEFETSWNAFDTAAFLSR